MLVTLFLLINNNFLNSFACGGLKCAVAVYLDLLAASVMAVNQSLVASVRLRRILSSPWQYRYRLYTTTVLFKTVLESFFCKLHCNNAAMSHCAIYHRKFGKCISGGYSFSCKVQYTVHYTLWTEHSIMECTHLILLYSSLYTV